ncbi:unnamed protein product [Linum tenue]|uniref:Uncharacterized protein n=1 Tax=Linum tenue TaxID=586396 RepID=A0AAV0MEI2_9ROSI|nr:unnamed protein product [Linum tenue]
MIQDMHTLLFGKVSNWGSQLNPTCGRTVYRIHMVSAEESSSVCSLCLQLFDPNITGTGSCQSPDS